MAVSNYGQGPHDTLGIVPDVGYVGPAGNDEVEHYSWNDVRRFIIIQSHPSSGPALMYVKFNGSSSAPASDTDYDIILEPGDWCNAPPGIRIKGVSIFFSEGPKVAGTDFTVKGW